MLTITSVLTNPIGGLEVTDFFSNARVETPDILTQEEKDAIDLFAITQKPFEFDIVLTRLSLNELQLVLTANVDEATYNAYYAMPETVEYVRCRNIYNARRGYTWMSSKVFS